MTYMDNLRATQARQNATKHTSAKIDGDVANRQRELNAQRTSEAQRSLVQLLAAKRPDITLIKYQDATNIILECNGKQQNYAAAYIRNKVDRLFNHRGGARSVGVDEG
ncbi:MAG: hypothetical protein ACKO0Z_02260 [Betaproteobacteria bacterium]